MTEEPEDTQTYANDSATSSSINTRLAQWRSPTVRKGKVYFIKGGDGIKIGYSISPEMRLGELQVGTHQQLELIAVMDGTHKTEGDLHERFSHLNIRGEWFRPEPELMDFIGSLTPPPQPVRQIQYRSPPLSAEARATIVSLIHLRSAHKADTPIGHCCSNLVEMITNMAGYERPEWAADERQTLPWMVKQQMNRLARLRAELN